MCTLCSALPVGASGFSDRMAEMLNHAAVVQMVSVGHRTGLFDAMDRTGPATVSGIAIEAGLNERYVREWLGAMVTGLVVDHNPDKGTFWLPEDHAAFLTRRAAPNNMAAVSQYIPVLAGVEDEIVECFRRGGGVPYESFPRFHDVMAEESGQTVVGHLFESILPLVPGIEARLASGIDVLDVGCGRGLALLAMAERFPASRFSGWDLSPEAIAFATDQAENRGLGNIIFEARDLTGFAQPESFDFITAFDAIHDQKDPASVLRGVARSLRRGGAFLMQDIAGSSDIAGNIGKPFSPLMYTISCMHCMTVSLAQGGVGLGAKWGEQLARTMLFEAGFREIETRRFDHDPMNAYFVARRA